MRKVLYANIGIVFNTSKFYELNVKLNWKECYSVRCDSSAWTIESSVIAGSTRNPVREMPGQGRHDGGRNQEISPVTSRQPTNVQIMAFLPIQCQKSEVNVRQTVFFAHISCLSPSYFRNRCARQALDPEKGPACGEDRRSHLPRPIRTIRRTIVPASNEWQRPAIVSFLGSADNRRRSTVLQILP